LHLGVWSEVIVLLIEYPNRFQKKNASVERSMII